MKEFKLRAWPDLPASFRQVGYRRLLSDLSHRHISESELLQRSELSRPEVRGFLDYLQKKQMLDVRPCLRREARWAVPGLSRIKHWWRGVRA